MKELKTSLASDTSRQAVWQPTPLLRWKKIYISDADGNGIGFNTKLQQCWIDDLGNKEWINVPTED